MFDAMRLVAETGSLAKSPRVEFSCAYLDCPSRRKILSNRRDRLVLSDGLLGNKRTCLVCRITGQVPLTCVHRLLDEDHGERRASNPQFRGGKGMRWLLLRNRKRKGTGSKPAIWVQVISGLNGPMQFG